MNKITKLAGTVAAAVLAATVAGCTDADVASNNLSRDADNFKIMRRVVFFNGITDTYLLSIEGRCAIIHEAASADTGGADQLEVTCKVGDQYKKHFLGLSDNVTYFVEQVDGADVSPDHYKISFKPPNIDVEMR
jgi:hypothetical protein